MIVLNLNTKKAQQFINNYEYALKRGNGSNLWEFYGTYSRAKEKAMQYCKQVQYKYSGHNGVIAGGNTMCFSYAFTGKYENMERLFYITKSYDYVIPYGNIID